MGSKRLRMGASAGGAISVGLAVAVWGFPAAASILAVALVLIAAVLLRSWALSLAVLTVAAVPHGSFADPVLSIHFGPFSVLWGEVAIAVALAAALADVLRTKTVAGPSRGKAILALWLALIAVAFLRGIASGYPAAAVLQDVRPLVGYLGFWMAWQLRSQGDESRVSWAIVIGCALVSLVNVVIVTTGWEYATFMTDSGRVWFRNGVLYLLALPLGLFLRGAARRPVERIAADLCIGLTVVGLLVSGTRSYWIAAGLAVALYGVSVLRTQRTLEQVARVGIAASLTLLVLVIALVGTSSPVLESSSGTLVGQRLNSLSSLSTDSSLATRWYTYVTTNRQLSGSWMAGKGLGSRIMLTGSGWMTYSTEGQYVDNVPQTAILKTGMLGLAVLLTLWGATIIVAAKNRVSNPALSTAWLCATPGMALLLFSSSYLVVYSQLFVFAVIGGHVWSSVQPSGSIERRGA